MNGLPSIDVFGCGFRHSVLFPTKAPTHRRRHYVLPNAERTPSGHGFSHTPIDLTLSYTPPSVTGGGTIGYQFNVDRQPTAVQRPDAQTTAFGYETGGRLSSVTFSRGVLQYGYDTAGRVSTLVDPGGVSLAFTDDGALPPTETWSGSVAGAVTRTFTTNFVVKHWPW